MPWSDYKLAGAVESRVRTRIWRAANFEEGDRIPVWDYVESPGLLKKWRRDLLNTTGFGAGESDRLAAALVQKLGIDLCWGFGGVEAPNWRKHGPATPTRAADCVTIPVPELVHESWIRGVWVPWVEQMQAMLGPRTLFVPSIGSGFYEAVLQLGQEAFWYAMADHPSELAELLEVEHENAMRFARVLASSRLAPVVLVQDDIAARSGLLYAPRYLRENFLPGLKRCAETLKSAGIVTIFHSDGRLINFLDELLSCGIDGLHPLEPLCDMHVGVLKERLGRRALLVGGVDATLLLPLGGREAIRGAVSAAAWAGGAGGGYFMGSSGEILPYVPPENVIDFFGACEEFGEYPLALGRSRRERHHG